jgi:hypothetical protein
MLGRARRDHGSGEPDLLILTKQERPTINFVRGALRSIHLLVFPVEGTGQ